MVCSTIEFNARNILKKNYRCEEGSFIYYLYEEAKFEQQMLIELTHTYEFILKCILYHFAPNDLYKIKFFPRIKYNYYIERLDFAVEAFFKDLDINKVNFGNFIKHAQGVYIFCLRRKEKSDIMARPTKSITPRTGHMSKGEIDARIERVNACERQLNINGLLDDEGKPSPYLKMKSTYMKDFFGICNELSLSPQSRAKLANINVGVEKEKQDPLLRIIQGGGG